MIIYKRTKLTCIVIHAVLTFSHKEVVILIEKQFSFFKLKNTKNHFFVSGTAKTAHKIMHVSFVLEKILVSIPILEWVTLTVPALIPYRYLSTHTRIRYPHFC
jgi:hypothetical protein